MLNYIKEYNQYNVYYHKLDNIDDLEGISDEEKILYVINKLRDRYDDKYSINKAKIISGLIVMASKSDSTYIDDIGVYVYPDDWYFVECMMPDEDGVYNDVYYKCDQLDGLFRFIDEVFMSHRLVESYDDNSSEYYHQISYVEYENLYENITFFSNSEVKDLMGIFKRYGYDVYGMDMNIISSSRQGTLVNIRDIRYRDSMFKFVSTISNSDYNVNIYINNLGDEWYLVFLYYNNGVYVYYKCDQMDGIKKLISDKLGIDYIKEYNGYNEYYHRIVLDTTHERADLAYRLYYSVIKLDDIKRLRSLFPDSEFSVYNNNFIISRDYDDIISNYNESYNNLVIKGSFYLISIYSLSDDWYYVFLGGDYFKCDQFDGLERLISDKLGIDYIKESNQNNSDSEFYHQISFGEYNNFISNDLFIFFDSGDIVFLRELFDGYRCNVYVDGNNSVISFNVISDDYNITVNSLGDEWYIVSIYGLDFSGIWRCDQLDGIEKLILDKLWS